MSELATRAEFLERRRHGLGSSDAPVVVGLRGSKVELADRKLGLLTEDEPTWAMRIGTVFEDAVATLLEERLDTKLVRPPFRQHPRWPWMFCHADRRKTGARELVEIKVAVFAADRWGEDGDPDGVPADVRVQVNHQLETWGYDRATVAAWIGGNDLRTYPVVRDRVLVRGLVDAEHDFWQAIQRGERPEPDGSEEARQALMRRFRRAVGEERVATADEVLLVDELRRAIAERKAAEAAEELLRQRVMERIGEAKGLVGPGFRITWVEQPGRVKWQEVARVLGLAVPPEAYALAVANCTGEPSRRFTPSFTKGA